jgi:hypothetical protein
LGGLEEKWRDTVLWLLSGHASVFEVRAFYHHIRENCGGAPHQIRDIKRALGRVSRQAYDLMDQLKYCSPLGPILRAIRSSLVGTHGAMTGIGTIRKLGITSIAQIAQMDLGALVDAGAPKRFAKQIHAYSRRHFGSG